MSRECGEQLPNEHYGEELKDEDETPSEQYWQCQECGYEDHNKPMPINREKFYQRPESPKCPKCHSIGFVPIGY